MSDFLWKLCSALIPLRLIEVRMNGHDPWYKARAWFGVYHAIWWAGPFPLRLTKQGTGIILCHGMAGTGREYPGFNWRKRT